jgi:4-amino-4-deoxychorismate lyase
MHREFLETIRLNDGELFYLSYHQKRVENVFQAFSLECCVSLRNYLKELPKKGLYRVRVVYTLNGDVEVSYIPYKKRDIEKIKLLEDNTLEYKHKYAKRDAIDTLFAKRGECDEILITQNGYIRDTSIANVAFFDGTTWWTPKTPLLKGTTRERLLQKSLLKEKEIHKDEIFGYKGFALMNAMIDFDIITQVNLKDIMC